MAIIIKRKYEKKIIHFKVLLSLLTNSFNFVLCDGS